MFEFRTYSHRGWPIWVVARDIPRGGCLTRAVDVSDFISFHLHPLLFIYWYVSTGLTGEVTVGFDLTVCAYRRYGTSGELCLIL